ncbi:uncharacterized protein LOC132702762 isoform X2 [Cylas formicarius]|nr:uncharacterized protein LOC132702762 isoform X2 [Cylas formicarius]
MMIFSIKREFKKVADELDCRLTQIKKQVANKSLVLSSNTSVICNDKENILKETCQNEPLSIPRANVGESPDMFHICDKSDNSVVISDDDEYHQSNKLDSPEIKKSKRSNLHKRSLKLEKTGPSEYSVKHFSKQKQKKQVAAFTLRNSSAKEMRDFDTSVVAATPPVAKIISKRGIKTNSCLQKKKQAMQNNSTLTQIFLSHKKIEIPDFKEKTVNSNLDETYVDLDGSHDIGITKMISLLNKNESSKEQVVHSIDFGIGLPYNLQGQGNSRPISTQKVQGKSIDGAEKSGMQTFLNSKDINEFFAQVQGVPDHQLEAEPIVRGKARQNLPGWACKECEKFYLHQDLNKTELMALNKCSKHRGLYRPREDTMPGYWDMNMITQEGDTT